jgi:hypothetical protein
MKIHKRGHAAVASYHATSMLHFKGVLKRGWGLQRRCAKNEGNEKHAQAQPNPRMVKKREENDRRFEKENGIFREDR